MEELDELLMEELDELLKRYKEKLGCEFPIDIRNFFDADEERTKEIISIGIKFNLIYEISEEDKRQYELYLLTTEYENKFPNSELRGLFGSTETKIEILKEAIETNTPIPYNENAYY